jgi:hypothetical protein
MACVTGQAHTSDVQGVLNRLKGAHAAGRGIRPDDPLIKELVDLIDHLSPAQRNQAFGLIGEMYRRHGSARK